MSPFHPWRVHFDNNRLRPLPGVAPPTLPRAQHAALARSLARFQLGESGEGRIAHEIDTFPGVDADYRAALKLFVAEEGRHAAILARMVQALHGTLLQRSWTERLFVHARRLFGIRFKLLVLLAAEVIGIAFYGLLARSLPKSAMADALGQICADEEAHLLFHCDFLSAQPRVLHWVWWPLGTAAALTVLWDHRHTLRAFGVPLRAAAGALLGRVRFSGLRLGSSWPARRSALA